MNVFQKINVQTMQRLQKTTEKRPNTTTEIQLLTDWLKHMPRAHFEAIDSVISNEAIEDVDSFWLANDRSNVK